MSQVAETLVAWREAQRRLEAAEDPDEIPALTAEAARLHEGVSEGTCCGSPGARREGARKAP